jgi:hypothetical protein
MKKKIIVILAVTVAACLIFGGGVYVGAATSGAGSQNDPVVSLSYLDYRLENLNISGNSGSPVNGYEKVTLSRGERYLPGEGGVIVLYSGSCTVIGKGIINLSASTVLAESSNVPAYSQMLVPDTSSGIVAAESTILYVVSGK